MEAATLVRSDDPQSRDRLIVKKGVITKRIAWDATEPFPDNPIYPGRLRNMRKRWGGYKPDLIGTPTFFDNSADAFPDYPCETIFVGDANHRRALAAEDGCLDHEFIAKIHRGLSRAEMYEIREGENDRRTVKPAETFLSRAERLPNGTERLILADVEGTGWHISRERTAKGLPYPNELTWIWRQSPAAMVRAILTYEAAFGVNPYRQQGMVIKGLGQFWIRYPDADIDRLVKAIKSISVPDERKQDGRVGMLYGSGKNQRENVTFIKSTADGIRYSLAMDYNRIARKGHVDVGPARTGR